MRGDDMNKKNNQYLLRADDELAKKIDETLDSFPRAVYPTKADLLREAIKLGLERIADNKKSASASTEADSQ